MKYQLQESKEPGWWVVTDTETKPFNKKEQHVCSVFAPNKTNKPK